jgi:outer membrane protein
MRTHGFSGRLRGSLLAAAVVLGGLVAVPRVAAAEMKIAVIDLRRAMIETEEGLRMQATLKKLFESRQVELDNKQRALQQEAETLEKDRKGGKVANEQLQRRYEKLQRDAQELQALGMEYQREMQRKESELTMPIQARIMGVVRRIAAQEGYEMVLERSAVPYFRGDLELTDRAIQMYNSGQAGDVGPGGKAPAGGKEPAGGDKKGAAPAGQKPAAPAQKAPAPAPAPAPKK